MCDVEWNLLKNRGVFWLIASWLITAKHWLSVWRQHPHCVIINIFADYSQFLSLRAGIIRPVALANTTNTFMYVHATCCISQFCANFSERNKSYIMPRGFHNLNLAHCVYNYFYWNFIHFVISGRNNKQNIKKWYIVPLHL